MLHIACVCVYKVKIKKYLNEGREKFFFKRTICGLIEIYDGDLSSCIFALSKTLVSRLFWSHFLHNSFWFVSCFVWKFCRYMKRRTRKKKLVLFHFTRYYHTKHIKLLLTTTFLDLLIKNLWHYTLLNVYITVFLHKFCFMLEVLYCVRCYL